jgi:hypothetical protein
LLLGDRPVSTLGSDVVWGDFFELGVDDILAGAFDGLCPADAAAFDLLQN